MTEVVRSVSWKHSIFAKLLLTMLVLATVIIVLLAAFLFFFVAPTIGAAVDRATTENLELLASTDPQPERIRSIASRLDLEVRFEGPHGAWTTDERLPSVDEVRRASEGWEKYHVLGRQYHVVARPNGDTYLFSWRFHRAVRSAHDGLLLVFAASVVLVVLAAHAILRAAIRPVEWLRSGFAQLSAGNLDVSVARRTNDEFGVLTDAFNYMVGRVREMVNTRDQLLLDVSHELRSPLTRMKVALALSDDNEQKAHLLGNVAEMEAMVTELLELERLRGGRGLQIEDCDLVQLLEETVQRFQHRAPGVRLCELPTAVPLRADPQKLTSVVDNLLENAFKYSLSDSRPVEIRISKEEYRVELQIDDDGPGIPEADRVRLFEPFFRVDRSRSRRTGGFGLGLSLCQRIVDAHGGTIRVEQSGMRGSRFVVILPI